MDADWFSKSRFGFMTHWGLYSLPAGEWKGQRCEYIGEWIQSRFRIPNEEYGQLAAAFNPILYDADAIVRQVRDCGMKYAVVTSKHHEGFAMYHSEVDPYNIYDATPFKRDPIAELAEACYKYGIQLGLYYSQDLDWHEPDGGGYTVQSLNGGNMTWTNDWDFPDNGNKDYTQCFEKKIKPQVKEILTKFGRLGLIWFDTPRTISPAQSKELYDMVKEYQPDCLINSRIGNGYGDYASLGDNQIPAALKADGLFETPATLNDTWGFKSFDQNWKSPEEVIMLLQRLSSRNVNYLLNIGLDHLGRLPAEAARIMAETGEWVQRNGEALYGCEPSPFVGDLPFGVATKKDKVLYFLINNKDALCSGHLQINGIQSKACRAELLNGELLDIRQRTLDTSGHTAIDIELPHDTENLPVVKVSFEDKNCVDMDPVQQADGSILFPAVSAEIKGGAALGRAGDIEGWYGTDTELSWQFTLYEPGTYDIKIISGSDWRKPWAGGHQLRLACNDAVVSGNLQYDSELDSLTARNYKGAVGWMGTLCFLKQGKYNATLSADYINPEVKSGFVFRSMKLEKRMGER
jgi:alpha-L-fucosidase